MGIRFLDCPTTVGGLSSGAILDEIQHVPELTSYLQGIVDDDPTPGRFILTGSQNFAIRDALSQSLAGRTALLELFPFELSELKHIASTDDVWRTVLTGAYPAIHDRGVPAADWLGDYVGTYVERDVRSILNVTSLATFQTFLRLAAGRSGQLLNLSNLAADTGVDYKTVGAWIAVLEASYVAIRLKPYFANVSKRLTKTPKLCFLDTGLLCYLLDIRSVDQLRTHPLRGSIFETWVVSEIHKFRAHRRAHGEIYFYRDKTGNEVDLLIPAGNNLDAIEIKSGSTLGSDALDGLDELSRVLDRAEAAPSLHRRFVIYTGDSQHDWRGTTALPWSTIDAVDWTRRAE